MDQPLWTDSWTNVTLDAVGDAPVSHETPVVPEPPQPTPPAKRSASYASEGSLTPIQVRDAPVQIRSHIIVGDILSAFRTLSNGVPDPAFPAPSLRFAPGAIILHLPRSADPLQFHSLHNFPD